MDLNYLVKNIKETPQGLRLRQAEVVAHDSVAKNVDLKIAGDSNILPKVKYLKSYTVTVGDVVFVLSNGADLLVLGDLA